MDTDGDGAVDSQELLDFIMKGSAALKDDVDLQTCLDEGGEGKSTKELLKGLTPHMPKIVAALLEIKEDYAEAKRDAEGSTQFTKHMQLRDGRKDPYGIKVRPRKGVAAMECLVANDPSGLAAKLGAALMLGATSQLRDIGYEEGTNLRGYGYDWRMPCTKMEQRDGYFSSTIEDMEDSVNTNGAEKIVVVTHSLGGVHATYFFTLGGPFGPWQIKRWSRLADTPYRRILSHCWAFGRPLMAAPLISLKTKDKDWHLRYFLMPIAIW